MFVTKQQLMENEKINEKLNCAVFFLTCYILYEHPHPLVTVSKLSLLQTFWKTQKITVLIQDKENNHIRTPDQCFQ